MGPLRTVSTVQYRPRSTNMAQRLLKQTLLLMLFCASNCQIHSHRRFVPFKDYVRAHKDLTPTERITSAPRFTVVAPDLLRADSQENIYVEAVGLTSPVRVSITIQDFSKTSELLSDSLTLSQGNEYQALKSIQLGSEMLDRNERTNKFVYLKVNFEGYHTKERVMMVTFHSGYIFIQTDKPIYNPGDTVMCRAFVSAPSFMAFNSSITLEFQNPEGIVVKQFSRTRAIDGVVAETFALSKFVNEGKWAVIAKFDHWQQNTFSSQFEVKKYVLPAFNVTLTPQKSFLSLDDTELAVEISAKYLYGEQVEGTAYVVFGVEQNKELKRLPSVKNVFDLNNGVAKLSMDELRQAYPDIRSVVGCSVYVKASVLTKSGGDLVEALRTGIKIVESPYVISFKDQPKFFKPGLPFDFTVQVSHHDGSPAHNVPVKLSLLEAPLVVASGSSRVTINMPKDLMPQNIAAVTVQDGLRPEQQAKHQTVVRPYIPFNRRQQNFLHISADKYVVSLGDTLSVEPTISTIDDAHRELVTHLTYLVFSKGKIIVAKRQDVTGQRVINVLLTITKEMMPSFRFVAYYTIPWAGQEEVVADSIWVDVDDTCVGGLSVGPTDGGRRHYTPGKTFSFRVKGDPGANVHLVAVDNAVYLLNKQRLTQRKIWDVVEKGDIGCTRGGGANGFQVFSDAGLLFTSSSGSNTQTRQALQCPGSARRRRSAELLNRRARLEVHYKDKLLRLCCMDGLREIPMPYSCTRRSLYITEGWECIQAFRYCCAHYRDQELDTMPPLTTTTTTPLPPTTTETPVLYGDYYPQPVVPYSRQRGTIMMSPPKVFGRHFGLGGPKFPMGNSMPEQGMGREEMVEEDLEEEEEEYLDESQVYLRSKFYESWLWRDLKLPTTTSWTDGLASMTMDSILPDSITEWGLLAISSSPDTGFCAAQPYNIKAWKPFFVDLKLPYSVARNEQVEIKAVIQNYGPEDLHVRVVLMQTENMCSVAFNQKHTQEVSLPAGSSSVVAYTIVPLVAGRLPVEVMVTSRDLMGSDRIQKQLRVVMEGVQKTKVQSFVLDPSAVDGGRQLFRIGKVQLNSVVPNSQPETFINTRGNLLADSIDNSITEDSLASLIRMPGGCVEQNLATITLPLIATLYLDRTNGWESVGVQRKAEALGYIRRGYEKQLTYRRSDGSYPPYRKEGASTWITAYVVKVFAMAHTVVGVDEQEVCDALLYLLENKQERRGQFREDNPVFTMHMTGGLRGGDSEITLTAFVLIALVEAEEAGIQCTGDPGVNVEAAIRKTATYLKTALNSPSRRPYTVAIASYALTLLAKDSVFDPTRLLLRAASPDGNHWPDSQSSLFTLEATGYALLALVKGGHMEKAAAPFKWLTRQRRIGGGYGSTQSTMVVLQALSAYLLEKPPEDLSMEVNIRGAGRRALRYHFDPKTSYLARSSRVPLDAEIEVEAQGNGQGILEVVTYYNQLHEADEEEGCKDFELSVAIEESREKPPADVEKSYQLTIRVRALGPRDVRMVILDVSLPTGFTPDQSDLEQLTNRVDHYISNFQVVDNLSDRGSLILHLFKVSHREPEILTFKLQQRFRVGILQPSSVTVYEYYNPDHRCSHLYTPTEDREDLSQICQNNVCRCTQGDCCVSKSDSETFPDKTRETFACRTLHHVYKVTVLNISQSYYDTYDMELTQVIKMGNEAAVQAGQRRLFMSHGGCRDGLHLQEGSQYLIIGPEQDLWKTSRDTFRFNYMLGKNTWVERWPSSAECTSDPSLQSKCTALKEAAFELSVNACRL
ncbi:complement component c3b, tandem duplicate 2 [Lampris incognitus]|uniref:complement component c3b, tandem duplicate 2 n=1 Tax=Lampris incognitus TaxID=2546036 RepID=UPI0024B5ECBB|nr:complement component c3b, tandem duplicate 2 [Lampris incognitus]